MLHVQPVRSEHASSPFDNPLTSPSTITTRDKPHHAGELNARVWQSISKQLSGERRTSWLLRLLHLRRMHRRAGLRALLASGARLVVLKAQLLMALGHVRLHCADALVLLILITLRGLEGPRHVLLCLRALAVGRIAKGGIQLSRLRGLCRLRWLRRRAKAGAWLLRLLLRLPERGRCRGDAPECWRLLLLLLGRLLWLLTKQAAARLAKQAALLRL